MKALSVHGGGDESERISDNDGGCKLVVVAVCVEAIDSMAVLTGLEEVMVDSASQSGRTDDGRGDRSLGGVGHRYVGDCPLNLDPLMSPSGSRRES
jgi:hypothetical protein